MTGIVKSHLGIDFVHEIVEQRSNFLDVDSSVDRIRTVLHVDDAVIIGSYVGVPTAYILPDIVPKRID